MNRSEREITFDDGEQSQYHNALPLLTECEIKATYFVTPGLIGTAAKFLGWDELRALQAAGHSIQSHGWSHKFLTFCSEAELAHELRASKQSLEDNLGNAVEEISVPGGRWNPRVIHACAAVGYKRIYVSDPWIEAEIAASEVIGRFMVRRNTTIAELKKIVEKNQARFAQNAITFTTKGRHCRCAGRRLVPSALVPITGYNEFDAARQQDMHS